ncbi:hypothetical protein F5883DRAFT_551112 [Diaporthe sp. PMI_573]|nr:hypothetical protein F5883DRAFT_551112 [Diaporthaceae sp. PMI_573]
MGYTCTGTAAICSLDTSTLLDSITNQDLSNREQRCFDHTRRLPARSRNQESEELRCPAAGDDGQPRGWLGWLMGPGQNWCVAACFFVFFKPWPSRPESFAVAPISVCQSTSIDEIRMLLQVITEALVFSSRPAARRGRCDISMIGAALPAYSWRSRVNGENQVGSTSSAGRPPSFLGVKSDPEPRLCSCNYSVQHKTQQNGPCRGPYAKMSPMITLPRRSIVGSPPRREMHRNQKERGPDEGQDCRLDQLGSPASHNTLLLLHVLRKVA